MFIDFCKFVKDHEVVYVDIRFVYDAEATNCQESTDFFLKHFKTNALIKFDDSLYPIQTTVDKKVQEKNYFSYLRKLYENGLKIVSLK